MSSITSPLTVASAFQQILSNNFPNNLEIQKFFAYYGVNNIFICDNDSTLEWGANEQVLAIWYTLCMTGIPKYTLNKRHNDLPSHFVCTFIAAVIIHFIHIEGHFNQAIPSKPLPIIIPSQSLPIIIKKIKSKLKDKG